MELIGLYLIAAGLLVVAGTAKAAQPDDTARAVAGLLPSPPSLRLLRYVVRVGALAEAALGAVALMFPRPATAALVAASYLCFFGVVAYHRGGPLATCGCFGTPDTPPTIVHVVINVGLAVSRRSWSPQPAGADRWSPRCRGSPGTVSRWWRSALCPRGSSSWRSPPGQAGGGPAPGGRRGGVMSSTLVDRASEFLESRLSRRNFINRSAFVGSALAVGGVEFALHPGTAYGAICSCGDLGCDCGSTCCSGFSEFCCVLNGGYNYCPTGTVIGGWWQANGSAYCSGPRYYLDCSAQCNCLSGCTGGFPFCDTSCDGTNCTCALEGSRTT